MSKLDLNILNQLWSATVEMYLEAIEKGYEVNVSDILRNVKSLLNELNLREELQKEEWLIVKVFDMINDAQQRIFMKASDRFVKKWDEIFKRILKGEKIYVKKIYRTKFYSGLPRDKKWIVTSNQEMVKVAMNHGLEIKKLKDKFVIIGNETDLKRLAKIMREKI